MSDSTSAAALREAFDRGFATARGSNDDAQRDAFISLRAHGQRFVVSVADVAGVYVDRKIVPVPVAGGAPPGLLGVASLRGAMTPVYDLGFLLGAVREGQGTDASPWRWMLVVRQRLDDVNSPSICFAFAAFDAHLRTRREDLRPAPAAASSHFVKFALLVDAVARPLVDMKALFESVKGPQPR